MKWSLVFVAAVAVLNHVCDAQHGTNAWKIQRRGRLSTYSDQVDQVAINTGKTEPTEEPPENKAPTPLPNAVVCECKESMVRIEVAKNLFEKGPPIAAGDLAMGDCPVIQVTPTTLIIVSELTRCGSAMNMIGEEMIYSFEMVYTPSALDPLQIVRREKVTFIIECHYPIINDVSGGPLRPTWAPFSDIKEFTESLSFSLNLMTDDWKHVRPTNRYYLGSMLNIEAAVSELSHPDLRVYVSGCTATLVPETPGCSYNFLGNLGCMYDAQTTSSDSAFLPRVVDDKQRFQVEAFRFKTEFGGSKSSLVKPIPEEDPMRIKITCQLSATTAAHNIDSCFKQCNFVGGWWAEVGGTPKGAPNPCDCCGAALCASQCGVRDVGRRRREINTASNSALMEATVTMEVIILDNEE